MKDGNFFKDCSNFMEDLFQKEYAERSPNTSDGSKWYIPRHGAYHPVKLGKIRVVFDCSMEYLGYALGKQLIPGPDLTYQIIGVLARRHWGNVLPSLNLNVNEACCDSCSGKALTLTINLLIIRCVFIFMMCVHISEFRRTACWESTWSSVEQKWRHI